MPGVFHKRRTGAGYPPDWSEIRLNNTPDSVIDGFLYTKYTVLPDIEASEQGGTSWGLSQSYQNNKKIQYFPGNVDLTNVSACDRAFEDSSLEFINIVIPHDMNLNYMFKNAHCLRYAKLELASGIQTYQDEILEMFKNCYSLRDVVFDFEKLSGVDNVTSFFEGCVTLNPVGGISVLNDDLATCTYMFKDCKNLAHIDIESEGFNSFQEGCKGLGVDTPSGTYLNIEIGKSNHSINMNNGFEDSHIKGYLRVKNCSQAMEAFKNANMTYTDSGHMEIDISPYNNICLMTSAFQGANIDFNLFDEYYLKIRPSSAEALFKNVVMYGSDPAVIDLSASSFANCTTLKEAFANISRLTAVKFSGSAGEFANIIDIEDMFANDSNLTNDFINELLALLPTMTSYTGTKTLAHIGFTSTDYPAATIQNMTNYSTFTSAGWSIGY